MPPHLSSPAPPDQSPCRADRRHNRYCHEALCGGIARRWPCAIPLLVCQDVVCHMCSIRSLCVYTLFHFPSHAHAISVPFLFLSIRSRCGTDHMRLLELCVPTRHFSPFTSSLPFTHSNQATSPLHPPPSLRARFYEDLRAPQAHGFGHGF